MPRSCLRIFLDESGDLGFRSPRSSRHIVVAALATSESEHIERILKRMRRNLGFGGTKDYEFEFKKSSRVFRMKALEGVSRCEASIAWIAADKCTLPLCLRGNGELLYKSLCAEALGAILTRTHEKRIEIIFDMRRERWYRALEFDKHINRVALTHHTWNFPPNIRIRHLDSRNSSCLQIHDFVVGSIFRAIEFNDDVYYRKISSKTIHAGRWP